MSEKPVVCISGGTRGLGRAMVGEFIQHGATVAACGRNEDSIAELIREFGDAHLFQSVDVTDDGQVEQFANAAIDQLGPPDFLINNAGVINQNAPLWEV